MIYLDCAASSPSYKGLLRAEELELYANPSAGHLAGKELRALLEQQRSLIAKQLGLSEASIVFCSGATEANNLALYNQLFPQLFKSARAGGSSAQEVWALHSSLDHPSVSQCLKHLQGLGLKLGKISLSQQGALQVEKSLEKFWEKPHLLYALSAVDSESGRRQELLPLLEIFQHYQNKRREAGLSPLYLHGDFVQLLSCEHQLGGYLDAGFDSLSLSGHKIGAGRGSGLLLMQKPGSVKWSLSQGGGQEGGLRSGTENLGAIIALRRALELSAGQESQRYQQAQIFLQQLRSYPSLHLEPHYRSGQPDLFSPYIFSLSLAPLPSELIQRDLAEQGIMLGLGSACSQNAAKKRGQKYLEQGYSKESLGSLVRVSWLTGAGQLRAEEWQAALEAMQELQARYS